MDIQTFFYPNAYDEEEYSDYSHLGGIWEDIKSGVSSLAKGIGSIVKPIAPDLIYKGVTGETRPPRERVIIRQPIIQKAGLPTWALPVIIGAGAFLLLKRRK